MPFPSVNDNFMRSLPNQLTLARAAAIPVILVLFPLDFRFLNMVCAIVFALAALTDFFDGYLARRYNATSNFGALLDPIADKMLIAAALIVLAQRDLIWPMLAGILLCRDIAISGMRLVAKDHHIEIPVDNFGKGKTLLQDVGIFCLMINDQVLAMPWRNIGTGILWAAALLALFSGYRYFRVFREHLPPNSLKL